MVRKVITFDFIYQSDTIITLSSTPSYIMERYYFGIKKKYEKVTHRVQGSLSFIFFYHIQRQGIFNIHVLSLKKK